MIKYFQEALFSFIYPAICIHCGETLAHSHHIFCEPCLSLLELLNPEERCPHCFSQDFLINGKHCSLCKKQTRFLSRQAAVFEYLGPAATLIKRLKYGQQPYLAKGAGAFMLAQWSELNWQLPDALVPVPISFTHWLERGYNQSELLAQAMSELMQIPVWNVLGRKSGDYSQAGLSIAQRKALQSKHFYLKSGYSLQDKTLLLIDDVSTSGSTLNRCAEVLMEGCPSQVYGLTLCKA